MKKWIHAVCCLLFLNACTKDDNTLYYPVGDVDIEQGSLPLDMSETVPLANSYNNEDILVDTIAEYVNDPTLGKLTFKIDLKNRLSDTDVEGYFGTGLPVMHMSIGYKDGHYASEVQHPVFTSDDPDATYTINLRLKGELTIPGHEFMIDYIYASLAGVFHPYPLNEFIPEILMCKGGKYLGVFDAARRTCSFDITYNRSRLSFNQLYFNLFVNLAGQQRINEVKLRIDKESFFEIYAENTIRHEDEGGTVR